MGKTVEELEKQRDLYAKKFEELKGELKKVQEALPIFDGAVQAMNVAIGIAIANDVAESDRPDELSALREQHAKDKQEE